MIERHLSSTIEARLGKGKVILILGPRQVGKTTLTRSLLAKHDPDYLYLNGDEPDVPDLLSRRTSRALLDLFGRHRNVLIDEAQRVPDIGQLWENYLVSERQKINHYRNRAANAYFWRTRQQQKINYLEEAGGQLRGYEFTWNPRKRKKVPPAFRKAYPDSTVSVVTRDNFIDFVLA